MVDGEDGRSGIDERPTQSSCERIEAARLGDDDGAVLDADVSCAETLQLAHRRDVGRPSPRARSESGEGSDGVLATNAVRRQARIALKLLQGMVRVWSEDPVNSTGVKPKDSETTLEFGDIVAAQHRRRQIQQSIAQGIASIDQGRPRDRATDPVCVDAVFALERLECGSGHRAENAIGRPREVSEAGEASLNITDVFAVTSDSEGSDYRNSPSS